MGRFKEGNSGRPKGSKNKVNTEVRVLIKKIFDENYPLIQQD